MSENIVSVAVTGLAWMGGGTGSIESALVRLFREATQDILITAYTIGSSADLLFQMLETCLARGVEARLIINRLNSQSPEVITQLNRLNAIYPHFHLYDFDAGENGDLHAKIVVVDRSMALVGSSNLSQRGLVANHELAVLIEGPAAMEIARALDRLLSSRHIQEVPATPAWVPFG